MQDAQLKGASVDDLRTMLGRGRAKKGMFEGELDEGELEIGQVSAMISQLQTVNEVMLEIISGYNQQLMQIRNSFPQF